jgi:hypothetical protein
VAMRRPSDAGPCGPIPLAGVCSLGGCCRSRPACRFDGRLACRATCSSGRSFFGAVDSAPRVLLLDVSFSLAGPLWARFCRVHARLSLRGRLSGLTGYWFPGFSTLGCWGLPASADGILETAVIISWRPRMMVPAGGLMTTGLIRGVGRLHPTARSSWVRRCGLVPWLRIRPLDWVFRGMGSGSRRIGDAATR